MMLSQAKVTGALIQLPYTSDLYARIKTELGLSQAASAAAFPWNRQSRMEKNHLQQTWSIRPSPNVERISLTRRTNTMLQFCQFGRLVRERPES